MKAHFIDKIEFELCQDDRPKIVKKYFGKYFDIFLNWVCVNELGDIRKFDIPVIIEDGNRDQSIHLFLVAKLDQVANFGFEDQKEFYELLDVGPNDWVILIVSSVKARIDEEYKVGEAVVKFHKLSTQDLALMGYAPVPYDKEEIITIVESEMQEFVHNVV